MFDQINPKNIGIIKNNIEILINNNILDNFILKNSEYLFHQDYYKNLSGTHEYRLYSYLSTFFNYTKILDIGTSYGRSAIALSHNELNNVITYDIINHINNNLTINDIISKNLINYSINKAKRFKLIGTKLTELIKEGLSELNNQMEHAEPLDYIDTDEINDEAKEKKRKEKKKNDIINKVKLNEPDKDKFINNNVKEIRKDLFDRIEPYEGSEYASIKF